jgi:hypothetical protein
MEGRVMLGEKIGNISPVYLSRFEDLIKMHAQFGGGKTEDKYVSARSFSNVYEFYMYAYFLGLKYSRRIEIEDGDDTLRFWEVKNWRPKDLVDCLIASAIGASGLDPAKIEHMEDKEITNEIQRVRKTIESFANGGFDYIEDISSEDPDALDDDRFFINLLGR